MAEYNESQINSNETERISAEQQRIENEAKRQTKETEREAREATRQSNESTRISKEAERLAEEVNRVNAEASRVTAEEGRVDAENIRTEFYEGFNERLDVVDSQLAQITLNINSFKNDDNTWNDAFDLAYKNLPANGGCIFISQLIEIDRSIDLMELDKKYGDKRVHIKSNGWFETSIIKKGDFDGIVLTAGCSISDLRIDGNNTGECDGIWVNGSGCVLTNVSSFNHGGNGIKVGNKSKYPHININSDFCKFYNVHCCGNNNYGLVVSDEIDSAFNTSDANACMFYSLDIRLNKVGGILVENCIDNHFYSPMCEDNGEVGIKVGAECGGIHIYSPYIEKSTTEILLTEGSNKCIVFGSRCGTLNSNIIDNGEGNTVYSSYGSKFNGYYLNTPINMKEINLGEKDISGYYKIVQNSNKDLEIISCYGSDNVVFLNQNREQGTNIHCKSARFGSKDLLNSIRQRPSSITNAITITANSSIKTNLASMTNISATDVVIANPTTQLPNGISYYPIVNGDNSVSIVFTNSTSESVSIPQTSWRIIAFNVTTLI